MINCIYYNKLAFNCFPEAVLGKHTGNIKQQIGIVAFFGKQEADDAAAGCANTRPPHKTNRPTCSETVQVEKHAKNRIGDDGLPQRARRFFVAHKRDAKRPKDDNSKDYPHPNHVRGLAECDVQNVSGCLSEFYVE